MKTHLVDIAIECNKNLSELKPARDAHSCHITIIEPLAPGLTLILRSLAGYSCNAQ